MSALIEFWSCRARSPPFDASTLTYTRIRPEGPAFPVMPLLNCEVASFDGAVVRRSLLGRFNLRVIAVQDRF